ncbi:MAG TPA: alpha/beta fold hydrolase [Bryobacteraceae bacterium]|nr:alpha/beta fold hydrolase [Bryobacteraceae bacterium]
MTRTDFPSIGTVKPRRRTARWLLIVFVTSIVALAILLWRAPLWVNGQLTRFRLARAGIHSRSMVIDGMRIHYIEGGAGRPVVLLHGLASQAQQDWSALAPDLVQAGFHVYAPDLPGFGQSDKPSSRTYSIPEQAAFVNSFFDANHLRQTALGGLSMGGWIAATVALRQPQRISRLLLFDSAGLYFQPGFDSILFTPQTSAQVDQFLALVGAPARFPEFVKRDFLAATKRDSWVVRRAWDSMIAGHDVLDSKFSALKMPMLIVWGREDRVTPLALGEAMHRAAPQSVLAVCGGAGHIAPSTCADRVNPAVLAFLSGAGPQPGKTIALSGP